MTLCKMVDYLGILGITLILIGFILNETSDKFNQESYSYNIINLVGAGILVYYAYTLSSLPFLILNSFWSITALGKMIYVYKKS